VTAWQVGIACRGSGYWRWIGGQVVRTDRLGRWALSPSVDVPPPLTEAAHRCPARLRSLIFVSAGSLAGEAAARRGDDWMGLGPKQKPKQLFRQHRGMQAGGRSRSTRISDCAAIRRANRTIGQRDWPDARIEIVQNKINILSRTRSISCAPPTRDARRRQ
jgi:hypothetical protein